VFAAASCLSTRCLVDSTRVLVWYRLYFLRFLLICHWESLNLTYTWKFFFFGKYFKTLSQNSSGNKLFRLFSSQNCKKHFSQIFSLIFGPTSLSFLCKTFYWLFGPTRLFLTLRSSGRIASLFLVNFILQIINPLFLKNDWICGENHGLICWVFVAENNRVAQVVSGSFFSAHTFHSLRPKFLVKKIVVIIPLGFLFKQVSTLIFFIGFQSKIKSFKSVISRKKTDPSVWYIELSMLAY